MEAFIGGNKKPISHLEAFPPFIRFGRVYLAYWFGLQQSIEEKCQLFGGFLPLIKGALKDSNEILFIAHINQNDPSNFTNHSTLLDNVRDGLLPICDSARRYSFRIEFRSDKNSHKKVIESILKMPQIVRCSNVEITIDVVYDPIQLPVEEIAQWLNQKIDRIGVIGKKKEERFLKIKSWKIENVSKMCEHLIEVLFIS